MNLGPDKICHSTLRGIINDTNYRNLIEQCNTDVIPWSCKELATIKKKIRQALRKAQDNRCIFCRRIMKKERRNTLEDIEHFLDKSKAHYKKWSFHHLNLALSCHPCNMYKSTKDLGNEVVQGSQEYNTDKNNYKWLHPYLDSYHKNIEIEDGWHYSIKDTAPKWDQTEKFIRECGLDQIESIEHSNTRLMKTMAFLLELQSKAYANEDSELAKKLNNNLTKLVQKHKFNL